MSIDNFIAVENFVICGLRMNQNTLKCFAGNRLTSLPPAATIKNSYFRGVNFRTKKTQFVW